MSKKPVWLCEARYQYENFKKIIDYSGYDCYLIHAGEKNMKRTDQGLFLPADESSVDILTLKKKYSYIILTGSKKIQLNKTIDYLSMAEEKIIVQLPHSIVGALGSDLTSSMPLRSPNTIRGVFPRQWKNNRVCQERLKRSKWTNIFESGSHPFIVDVLERPSIDVIPNTLCILPSLLTDPKEFTQLIVRGLELRGKQYDTIYLKNHPLSKESSKHYRDSRIKEFTKHFEIIEKSSNKYSLTDSCSEIVTGISSMFVETNLRNEYFSRGQKIFAVNETNKLSFLSSDPPIRFSDTGIEFSDFSNEIEPERYTQYISFLESTDPEKVFTSYLDIINKASTTIITRKI